MDSTSISSINSLPASIIVGSLFFRLADSRALSISRIFSGVDFLPLPWRVFGLGSIDLQTFQRILSTDGFLTQFENSIWLFDSKQFYPASIARAKTCHVEKNLAKVETLCLIRSNDVVNKGLAKRRQSQSRGSHRQQTSKLLQTISLLSLSHLEKSKLSIQQTLPLPIHAAIRYPKSSRTRLLSFRAASF